MLKKVTTMFVALMTATLMYAAAAHAEGYANFPPDPKGVKIIDRASLVTSNDSGSTYYYAIIYNTKTNGIMKIYSAFDDPNSSKPFKWKELYTWKMVFEGDNVKLQDVEVITIASDDTEQPYINFWTDSFIGYIEGAVHMGLTYNSETGEFKMEWSD